MPSRRNETSIEDWLWHRLCMVASQMREASGASGDPASAFQPLLSLHSLLYDRLGESHFNAGRQTPLLFFTVLLHSLQPERALAFLSAYPEHADEALHLALALHHAGLLHTTSPQSKAANDGAMLREPPNPHGGEPPLLCLPNMLAHHVASWAQEDGATALQYLFLLRGPPGEAEALAVNILLAANRTEVLLTRLSFLPWPVQCRLMQAAAQRLHAERGLSPAAARLLFECQAYSPLCTLLLDLLSSAILESPAANPARLLGSYGAVYGTSLSAAAADDPAAEGRAKSLRDDAATFLSEWRRADADAAQAQGQSLELLLAIAELLYTTAEWRRQRDAPLGGEAALTAVLDRMGSLPVLPSAPVHVDAAQASFRLEPPQIQRLAPPLLLAAMEVTHAKFTLLRRNGGAQARGGMLGHGGVAMGADAELRSLRERAEALVAFAGLSGWRGGDAMGLGQMPAAVSQQLASWLSEMA